MLTAVSAADPKPGSAPELIAALDGKELAVRLRAIRGLGNFGTSAKAAIPALVQALKDPDHQIRYAAALALAQVGPSAIPSLVDALKSEDANTRLGAVHAIARFGPEAKDAIPTLKLKLESEDIRDRLGALVALAEIGPHARVVAPTLAQVMKDQNETICLMASIALARVTADPTAKPTVGLRNDGSFQPRAPGLTPAQEAQLDQLTYSFILADSGKLPGNRAEHARVISLFHQTVQQLGPQAIPALTRGHNRAIDMHILTCPSEVILRYLKVLIPACDDIEKIEYAMQNAGVGRNLALQAKHGQVQFLRRLCMQRKAELATVIQRVDSLNRYVCELSYLTDGELKTRLRDKLLETRWAATWLVASRRLHYEGDLIDRLNDSNADIRQLAHQALVHLSRGTDFGPAPGASQTERARAIERWRGWWAQQDYNPTVRKDTAEPLASPKPPALRDR